MLLLFNSTARQGSTVLLNVIWPLNHMWCESIFWKLVNVLRNSRGAHLKSPQNNSKSIETF